MYASQLRGFDTFDVFAYGGASSLGGAFGGCPGLGSFGGAEFTAAADRIECACQVIDIGRSTRFGTFNFTCIH